MKLILKTLWPELKPHLSKLIFVFITGAIISGLKAYVPDLIGKLPDVWQAGDWTKAYQIPILISVLWIVSSVLQYYHSYWTLYVSDLVAVSLRRKLMNKYLDLNLSFFQKFIRGSGGLISRMLNDISIVQGGIHKVGDAVREPFMAIFIFGYLLYLDWRLTIFILIALPIITGALRRFAKSLRKYSHMNQESMEDLTQILKESLDGTRIVQSFNLQDEMRRRFDAQAEDFLHSKRKIIAREEASGPVSESLAAFFISFILIYIGHQAINGEFKVGDFLSFAFAIGMLQDAVRKIQSAYIRLQQGAVAVERMQGILNETSVVPEVAKPKVFPKDWETIDFKNVTFSYDNHEILKNMSLTVKRGEVVALVGASGAGKSTLINLLPRFFDPSGGDIQIGGVSTRDMSIHDLRRNIALVSQDVFLFSDSIEKNIWSGDFSRPAEGIEAAAKHAFAHDFILRTPQGYHSRVGDRGSHLSGGEKQRVSIARAFFKDAPILILDEATSALDSESEQEVQKGLDSLLKGRTAFVIAHRLSTITSADRIIVLQKGIVVESGSHQELLAMKGEYARLYRMQVGPTV